MAGPGRVGSGHGSLISSKTWVGSSRVKICVGRVGSKKVVHCQNVDNKNVESHNVEVKM